MHISKKGRSGSPYLASLTTGSYSQGFFSRTRFFTGNQRNFRLPWNLGNLPYFSNELIQTNFELNFVLVPKQISLLSQYNYSVCKAEWIDPCARRHQVPCSNLSSVSLSFLFHNAKIHVQKIHSHAWRSRTRKLAITFTCKWLLATRTSNLTYLMSTA
jgi:hypothetical protein